MVIYLNDIPFNTIKRDDQILIQTEELWTFLRIPPLLWPDTVTIDKATTPGENRYEVGPYATVEEVTTIIGTLPVDYISESDREDVINFLEPSLSNRWDRQPEFTPLWRWWRPLP